VKRLLAIGNEIEDKQGDAGLKCRIGKLQLLGVADLKTYTVWERILACLRT
jgi:hypothetical protein